MAALEPPVPALSNGSMRDAEMATADAGVKRSWWTLGLNRKTGKRTIGLLMLAVVVFLWTASNFLASEILADDEYSKPFFITYVNTAFFVIPLVPILVWKRYKRPEELELWREDTWRVVRRVGRWVPFVEWGKGEGGGSGSGRERRLSQSASQELLLGDHPRETGAGGSHKAPLEDDDGAQRHHDQETGNGLPPLTIHETLALSLEFAPLWFLANYFVAACLEYTTVASSTILTSTSSVFTLLFGALFGVERFTLAKLLGVTASLAGIALISSQDFGGESSADDEHRGDFPEKTLREIAVGDAIAFASAVMYGIYAVLMKKRISDESRVSMPLFFGLVGLINVVVLLPLFPILHYTGVESFALPPTGKVTFIVLMNSLTSLVSDLCWAYAVLLTSPIVVTVGLSMTIPLSLVGQVVVNGQTASAVYWVGAGVVVGSFVFVNREEGRKVERVGEQGAVGGEVQAYQRVGRGEGEGVRAGGDEEEGRLSVDAALGARRRDSESPERGQG